MDIEIQKSSQQNVISFNYEELKKELLEKTSLYETVVYDADSIKSAKKDRAELNKLKKSLNDKRLEEEREYMKPFNDFKTKVNELISLVDKPVKAIDKQIKEYETAEKGQKKKEISWLYDSDTFDVLKEGIEWVTLDQIFNPRWLNASYSASKITDDINYTLANISSNMDVLSKLPAHSKEAISIYKETLDFQKALQMANKLSEIDAQNEVKEPVKQAEEIKIPKPVEEPLENIRETLPFSEEGKEWYSFSVYCTDKEYKELVNFIKSKKIAFNASERADND